MGKRNVGEMDVTVPLVVLSDFSLSWCIFRTGSSHNSFRLYEVRDDHPNVKPYRVRSSLSADLYLDMHLGTSSTGNLRLSPYGIGCLSESLNLTRIWHSIHKAVFAQLASSEK